MNRKLLWWGVLAIGILLIVAPFAMGLPGKAAAGERMMADFRPLMAPANVQTTADYYDDVFVPLGEVVPALSEENVATFASYSEGFAGMETDAAKLVPLLAEALGTTPAGVQAMMAAQLPAMSALLEGLPQMRTDFAGLIGLMEANVTVFARVPAGLEHYKPLVDTMQGNVSDYERIDSLPNFNLFTWFFVVPGVLLVLLAGAGLWSSRVLAVHAGRPSPVA